MFEPFRKYLSEKVALSDSQLQRIESLAISKHLRRKQYLLQENDVSRHYTFVCNGCLRLFRIDETGSEHIIKFAPENWWITDRESLLSGQPAKSNIDALEDTDILQWTKDNFNLILDEIPPYREFHDHLIARALEASTNRIYNNISMSAQEKYEKFVQTYPSIFNRVPLHMVASYLGVARETLTRIRNHVQSQE
jgi:CRP-like cAMP-binding protein